MANKKISASIALDGEKEFRQAITNIKTQAKLLTSEMKKVTAQFKENANSTEALKAKNEVLGKQFELQGKKVKELADALDNSKKNMTKNANAVQEYKTKLDSAREELERLEDSSESTTEEIEQQRKEVLKCENALEQAEKGYKKAENATNKWETELNNAEAELYGLENELDKSNKELSQSEKAFKNAENEVEDFGNELEDTSKKTSTFKDMLLANLASDLIGNGLEAMKDKLADMGRGCIEVGNNFHTSMSQVAATMGITADEINRGSKEYEMLEQAAKEAGATTKYSASESADALNYMALAGYDAEKAVSMLPKVLNLAAASGMELADASDLITDALTAVGESNADKFIDQLAKTAQKSNTNVSQLGEAILQVGGTAKNLKGGITEMNTVIGLFGNAGIKGAEAGTHLRNIILAMSPTTDKAKDAFKKLGVATYDTKGKMRALNDIFKDLDKAMEGMTDKQKQNFLTKIFNKTDLAAVTALLDQCGDSFDDLEGNLEKAEGAAEDMAKTLQNNLTGDIEELSSATEGLGIEVYDKFEGVFRNAVKGCTTEVNKLAREMTSGSLSGSTEKMAANLGKLAESALDFASKAIPKLIDGFNFIVDNGREIVSILGGMATGFMVFESLTAIANVITTFKELTTALKAAETAQAVLNGTMLANPYVALAAGIAGIVAAVLLYTDGMSDASTYTMQLESQIKNTNDKIDAFKTNMQTLTETFENNISEIVLNADAYDDLVDRLYKLNEVENKTKEQKQEMSNIIAILNKKFPDLSLAIDETTGKLNKQKSEIKEVIKAMKEQAIQEATQDMYTELTEKKIKAIQNQEEAQENLNEALANYEEAIGPEGIAAMQEYRKCIENGTEVSDELAKKISEITKSHSSEAEALRKAKESYDESSKAVQNVEKEYSNLDKTIAELSGNSGVDNVISDSKRMEEAAGSAATNTEKNIKGMISSYDKGASSASKSFIEQANSMTTFKSKANESLNSVNNVLSNNTKKTSEWKSSVLGSTAGLTSNFLANVDKMKTGTGKSFTSMTDNASKKSSEMKNKVTSNMSTLASNAKTKGSATSTNFNSGFASGKGKINSTASSISDGVKARLKVNTYSVGTNICSGISSGINAGKGSLFTKISRLASGLLEKAKSALGIHSPSREFASQVGQWIPAGISVGIDANTDSVKDSIKELSDASIQTAKAEFQMKTVVPDMQNETQNRLASSINTLASSNNNSDKIDQMLILLNQLCSKDSDVYIDSDKLVGATGNKFTKTVERNMNKNYIRGMRGATT